MKQPFYGDKTIDDANIGCDRVIISDCDNNHRYASLCELVEDCPSVKQLTKDCVIKALNDLVELANRKPEIPASKRFLRVTNSGCLEVADPTLSSDSDRNVAVSNDDVAPGPLDTKVKGSCSYDGLYCIDIEEAGGQVLVWRPSGPNGPFINPTLPTGLCSTGDYLNVVVKPSGSNWVVDYKCPDQVPEQYCKCIYTGGTSARPCIKWSSNPDLREQLTIRYYLPHANCSDKPDNYVNSYIDGDRVIKGTEAFTAPSSYGVVKINWPGTYEISFSTYVTGYQTWHSIRSGLYIIDDGELKELGDIKYQCGEYPGYPEKTTSLDNPALNRMFPDSYSKATWCHYDNTGWTLDNTGLPFSRTYIVNITKATEIYMVVKPDMRDEDPRVIKANDREGRYNIIVTGTNHDKDGASTSIEIKRLGNAIEPSRMHDITV